MEYILSLILIISPLISMQRNVHRGKRNPTTSANLNTNLVSFWNLDEPNPGDVRDDAIGANNLTDNSSNVGSAAGKVSNAANFSGGGGTYLKRADTASLSITSSFTFTLWVKFTAFGGAGTFSGIVTKWNVSKSYALLHDVNSNRFILCLSPDGSAQTCVTANTLGAPSLGVWYFIIIYLDDAANIMGISVTPDGSGSIASFDTAAYAGGVFDSADDFYIGTFVATDQFDGDIDAVGLWSYVLPSLEQAASYNSSNGDQPPF